MIKFCTKLKGFTCWIAGFCMLIAGCDLVNPSEEIPAYLEIKAPLVQVDPDRNLYLDAGVKDVWLSRNDDNLGIYPIPSVIPFIPDPFDRFTLNGGIFLSGFSAFRQPYPFWQAVQFDTIVQGLDTISIQPIFKYFSIDTVLTFRYEEKFEGASFQLQSALNGNAAEVRLNRTANGFEGNGSIFRFDQTATEMEYVSTTWFLLPQEGSNRIFLEVTYNNTIPFTMGLEYRNAVDFGRIGGDVFVNSEGEWNTLYFDFNDDIFSLPAQMEFRLFMRASGDGDIGEILLDNIRIVHFQE